MSNYRTGLAIANHLSTIEGMPGRIVSPSDTAWWDGFTPYLTERYDTPSVEKEAAQAGFLPLFLYWNGELIFHYMHDERIALRNAFYRRYSPKKHPIHSYDIANEKQDLWSSNRKSKGDPFLAYGGDYWMNALCRNKAFWDGLHKAGTRGLFSIEIGCEHSIEFQGYNYAMYNNHASPAWYFIVADLRRDTHFTLERVYPRPSDIPEVKEDEYLESTLHFYYKYEGQMIQEAMTNPHREVISRDELNRPSEPWYVW